LSALLSLAIRQAAAAISYDTGPVTATDPGLRRILRLGTQVDTRTILPAGDLPGTGSALSAQAVANYIAKYATKTTGSPGLPDRPVRGPAAIAALRCSSHHRQLISTCWELAKHPAAAQLALNRWTHMLGYRGHFLTKSRRYSVTFGQLRTARLTHRRQQRHPDGEKDPGAATPTSAPSWSSRPGCTPGPATQRSPSVN
jgi:hypothetical protein